MMLLLIVTAALHFVRWDEIERTVVTGFSAAFPDYLLKMMNRMFPATVSSLVSNYNQKLQ